jgi:hypothetical protein
MTAIRPRRWTTAMVAAVFITFQILVMMPTSVLADSADELKRIEYKLYFRGDYEKTIVELRAFLEREDLTPDQIVEAKEYLAASLILTGRSTQGKREYVDLLKMNAGYAGPDPSVFKAVVVSTFNEAKAEYAAAVINSVPPSPADAVGDSANNGPPVVTGKPFYKKWWFYATMGVVLVALAGAASGADEDSPPDRGTVTVEVQVP